jgi:hypothetical protein
MTFEKGNQYRKGLIPWNKGKSHLAGEKHPMYNKHHSKESLEKLSNSQKKRLSNPEIRKKMSIKASKRMKDLSLRKRISNNLKKQNIQPSKDNLEKLRIANKGKIINEGHKKILSDLRKKDMQNKEWKENLMKGFQEFVKTRPIERTPAWKGGLSFEPYDISFDNQLKREIRKRDNYICMCCGIHQERLKRSLDIHHVDYNKKLSIKENCISLCNNCHCKTNFNREHWKVFFQSVLNKSYGYIYEDKEIIIDLKKEDDSLIQRAKSSYFK